MKLTSPELRPYFLSLYLYLLSLSFLCLEKKHQSNITYINERNPRDTFSHYLYSTIYSGVDYSFPSHSHSPLTAMDTYEATKIVFSRIQSLDPENASKIMGYILIQDQGDEEMIRLAHGPDAFLFSLINQAKDCLGLSSNSSCSSHSTPSSPSPYSPTKFGPFPQTSPRITIPNNGFPSSSPSSLWSAGSPAFPRSPLSYAAVVNGSANPASSGSSSSPSHAGFYNGDAADQLAFLDEPFDAIMSPTGKSDSLIFPYEESTDQHQLHRRRCSVSDGFLGGSDDGGGAAAPNGLGLRPCMYFGRGVCKNGFSDSGDGSGPVFGSPSSKIDASFNELVRMKALQQQRFAAAAASPFIASGAHHPFSYNKCMNILNDNPRSAPAALMMGEDFRKFGRCRPETNDYSGMGLGGYSNSCSRQIYLTFPADSTFSEEDVSNYFSLYGPVQDVRIPYQQKRMFGFVTFVYPETVKRILAKGNPHFVCDSRVLVKPYKEKGNIPDKKQQHHMDRAKFGTCLSPSGLDSLEPHDLPFGPRMFYNSREAILRRKLEQEAELQQALELQERRLMNMQLVDQKNHPNYHHFQPGGSYPGIPVPSMSNPLSQNNQVVLLDNVKLPPWEAGEVQENDGGNETSKEPSANHDDPELNKSMENILPDNLFAFPTKSPAENLPPSPAPANADDDSPSDTPSNDIPALSATSTLNMASLQSCALKMPKLTSGQEAIEV
ncbi:PREDICTED: zinc finger CCCH domain-containing protein 53-like [Ipomoea nil]|uniref:zinc finger CCCH domain-containing protein 53-like n=1 Tax=Ipomoea nil TaxID=35883 RepID=UPI000900C98D|nr:PREDICTED: zinc finger CCCH domain-containing protein 53-like [Ipomoea nil]XP_019157900.1 PREDICTED: zinc finger CCCH domain-containing protein 53-like [Ipomoea nil]